MLLLDSLSVRDEAVQYSAELAKRMDSNLVVFVILPPDSYESEEAGREQVMILETKVKEALKSYAEKAGGENLSIEGIVRRGDPSSELMKLLAGPRAYQTIVWGGDEGSMGKKAHPKKDHWLIRMKDKLGCPVVVPSMKS